MKKISIAKFKRIMNGKKVTMLGAGFLMFYDMSVVSQLIKTASAPADATGLVSFNSVDMIRTLPNGSKSYYTLRGTTCYMDENGFILEGKRKEGEEFSMCFYRIEN